MKQISAILALFLLVLSSSIVFAQESTEGAPYIEPSPGDSSGNLIRKIQPIPVIGPVDTEVVAAEPVPQVTGSDSRTYDAGELSTFEARLRRGDKTYFEVNSLRHTIRVNSIGSDDVTITLSSVPVSSNLKVAETKTFDLDGDSIQDIAVTLDRILSGKAYLNLEMLTSSIEEPVLIFSPEPETPIVEETNVEVSEDVLAGTASPDLGAVTGEAVSENEDRNNSFAWIIAFALVAIVAVSYYFARRRK